MTTTTDLDGNPRIVGGTVDMGAYECQSPALLDFYDWLQTYALSTSASAVYADSDGDGMNNWQEWVCGTNPTNALSVLRMVSALPTSTNATVTWQSVAGVNYFLERSTNLASPFTPPGHEHHWAGGHHQLRRHQRRWRRAVLLSRGRSGSLRERQAAGSSTPAVTSPPEEHTGTRGTGNEAISLLRCIETIDCRTGVFN